MLGDLEAEGNVFADAEVGEERVVLEDRVERAFFRREVGDVVAVEQDAALIGRFETCGHAQQRRFAATGWTEQREGFAVLDFERHIIDRGERAEAFGDIFEA